MNLFDPLRPRSPLNQPTWLRAHIVIPRLELSPLPTGQIQLSLFLPIKNETGLKRYTTELHLNDIENLINDFCSDPELTCERLFSFDPHPPELRRHTPTPPVFNKKPISQSIISSELVEGF